MRNYMTKAKACQRAIWQNHWQVIQQVFISRFELTLYTGDVILGPTGPYLPGGGAMKLFLSLVASLVVILTFWVSLGSAPSGASNGQSIFLPLLWKAAWTEPVTIVQRDGRQAVYWPNLITTYYPPSYPRPTPVPVIPAYLEVQNNTGQTISQVRVEFQASDSSGSVITQTVTQGSALIDGLKPGQRSPVVLYIPFPGGDTAFQSATKNFTVLPDWSSNQIATQEGLEISWNYPPYIPPYYPSPTPTVPPTATPTAPAPPSIVSALKGVSSARLVATSTAPVPPNINGWVKNTGSLPVSNVSVVVTIRGNDRASRLVLDATKVSLLYYSSLAPGNSTSFQVNFSRDYGALFGTVEAVALRRLDIPVILGVPSW